MIPNLIERIRVWEWRLLLLLLYILPNFEAPTNLLWGIIVGLWLFRCFLEKNPIHLERVEWAALFWLLAGIWSLYFTIDFTSWKNFQDMVRDPILKGFWDMVRGAMLLWIAKSHFTKEQSRTTFLYHLVFATGLASLIGWCDYARALKEVYDTNWSLRSRVQVQLHSVGHYNHSGIYLAIAWIAAVATLLYREIFSCRWLARLAMAFIGLALLGTTARFAIATAALGTLLVLCKIKPPRWFIYFLIAGVFTVTIGIASSPVLRNRAFFQGSFNNRLTTWEPAWETAKAYPWTGIGLNRFNTIQIPNVDGYRTVGHAHNLYFNTLAQIGFPGIIALLWLLAASAGLIWKRRLQQDQASKTVYYATGGAWFVITLGGMSNTTLHHEVSMLFFLMIALALGNNSAAKKTAAAYVLNSKLINRSNA